MMIDYDTEYARGMRAPGPIPTRDAWMDIRAVRKAVYNLEKVLIQVLADCSEKPALLHQFDILAGYTESLIIRYARSGPPENQSDIGDMEATIRLATKNPKSFKMFDLDGLKKTANELRKNTHEKEKAGNH